MHTHTNTHTGMHTLFTEYGVGKANLSSQGSIPGSFQEEEDWNIGERARHTLTHTRTYLLWLWRAWLCMGKGKREPSAFCPHGWGLGWQCQLPLAQRIL